MRRRLRLSEFTFDIRYKKCVCNIQADALSRLHTLSSATADADATDLPSFLDAVDFSEEDFALDDAVLLASAPPTPQITPISYDELVTAQFHDDFCIGIRCRLNKGGGLGRFSGMRRGYPLPHRQRQQTNRHTA